ncbi:hypothetical protein ACFOWA_19950 [Pedobacter lithocola]|uniref:Uncharacterized protein n=1 Tax=Pedobacter lithocola TaxID=1908239 RepID=A0ABV8PGK1_9SPHI
MSGIKIFEGMTTNERLRFSQMAALRLKDLNYDVYQECIDYSKRKIDDPDLLGIIMLDILEVYELKPENYPIILATAYWFIAPFKILYKELKLKIGFRPVIQKAMGFNSPESVSMFSNNLDVYYKNPRFKTKVHEVGERIMKELQDSGYMEKNSTEWGTE